MMKGEVAGNCFQDSCFRLRGRVRNGYGSVRVASKRPPPNTSSVGWSLKLTGVAAVFICPAAAIAGLVIAVRFSRAQDPAGLPRRLMPRLPAGARHLLAGLITFVVLESMLWTGVVIRATLSEPVRSALPGSLAADYQSGLLLACAAVAVIAALPGSYGSYRVLVTGAVAAAAVSIWGLPASLVSVLWHPVAGPVITSFASLWGTEAFWGAVVFAAPIAVAGLVVGARLRTV